MTFLKTFWAAFLAMVAFSALAALVISMFRESPNDWKKVNADLDKAIATPGPFTQGSEVRLNRDVTVRTASGSVTITEGTKLYIQGFSEGAFTCYYNGQPVQIPRVAVEVVK